MYFNKFTILIPTRERSETLFHTIRTCLNQSYQNLEIIICDNFSNDNTKEIVMSFNDERLKYFNTGKRLSMSENFDFALSKTTDGYVMFIGDDDGILPNSLEYVNDIINSTGCHAIVSHNAFYTWPGTSNPNQLTWDLAEGYEIRLTKEWLQRYFSFQLLYTFDLPGAYCGFVKRSVFDNVVKEGYFFRSSTPDSYSALAISFVIDSYVYSFTPFAIHGSSSKSNGRAYLSAEKNKEGEEYKKFCEENTIKYHKDVVVTKSFRIISVEAFLQFSEAFPELTKNYSINWKLLMQYILTEKTEVTKDEIESAVKEMCEMHKLDYNEILTDPLPKTINRYADVPSKQIFKKAFNKIKRFINKSKSHIEDTTKFGVNNIYDAVLLLKFLTIRK